LQITKSFSRRYLKALNPKRKRKVDILPALKDGVVELCVPKKLAEHCLAKVKTVKYNTKKKELEIIRKKWEACPCYGLYP